MTYQDALAYIYSFSDFERTGQFARDPEGNLRRMRLLLAALGDPQTAYATTHIAGTKGKGSTAAILASCLTASGVTTGLYSQPDLHTFRERIQIDGTPISEAEVAALVPEIQAALARLDPADAAQIITYEVGTALAFLAFARHGVTHAVIEVGLGGRLDATNVIQPLVGIITSISYDHTAILGNTLAAIAGEKAGIIKPGMALVTSAQAPEALAVITATCAERGVPLTTVGPTPSPSPRMRGEGNNASLRSAAGFPPISHLSPSVDGVGPTTYTYDSILTQRIVTSDDLLPAPFTVHTPSGDRTLHIALLGAHQRENATAALAALDLLRERGVPVTDNGVREGMLRAQWPARLDVVGARPWLVVDGAHNADSLARLLEALTTLFVFDRLTLVFGTMRDKDVAGMAVVLAQHASRLRGIIVTQGHTPRAYAASDLAAALAAHLAVPIMAEPDSGAALARALHDAAPKDLVCLTGSIALAGEGLRWIAAQHPSDLTTHIGIAGVDHP